MDRVVIVVISISCFRRRSGNLPLRGCYDWSASKEVSVTNPMLDDEEKTRQKTAQNIRPLFEELKKQLGGTFEKKVFGRSTGRNAMYVWKREKDVVTFHHTPVALQEKGKIFGYQLTIAPSLDFFGDEIATDSLPEDKLLWADAMGKERKAFPSVRR